MFSEGFIQLIDEHKGAYIALALALFVGYVIGDLKLWNARQVNHARAFLGLFVLILSVVGILPSFMVRYAYVPYLGRSYFDYHQIKHFMNESATGRPDLLVNSTAGSLRKEGEELPNVVIVFIESFNRNFVERKVDWGDLPKEKPYSVTPFFDSLVDDSFFVSNFYGSSIQTIRGQLATLCGIHPSFREKVSFDKHINLNCLPRILKKHGYRSYLLQAHSDLGFDRTGDFFVGQGFDFVSGMDATFVTDEEWEAHAWGWGIQDDLFFRKAIDFLEKEQSKHKQPLVASLTTISNHMMFTKLPPDQRELFSNPNNYQQYYANSIRAADNYLKVLVERLYTSSLGQNTILMILGDHSYPIGEHNNFYNAKGAYEENFKTPFLMQWRGKLESQRITDGAFSQVDVLPTVLDALGIEERSNFAGRSILDRKERIVFASQPYDGTYLVAYNYR
jgi:phosphoglycerol transferase MdoB-like AlkP superfamily enzyme